MGNEKGRWSNGRGYSHNEHLTNAIKKYGWENFKHYVLAENIPERDLDEVERHYIRKFDAQNPKFGYNEDSGGCKNKRHSERTKKKISETEKGKKVSDKTRKLLSKSHIGKSVNAGVPKSQEHKEKLSESLKGKYIAEDCARSMPIEMVDIKTNEVLMEFSNAKEAAKYINHIKAYSHIRECCRGQRKYCCGYFWRDKE